MTEIDITIQDVDYTDFSEGGRKKWLNLLKFYLLPTWRNPEFTGYENEIEKIKSKRRIFRRLLNPLTIIGFLMLLFILILAVYGPWLTKIPLQELTLPFVPSDSNPFDEPSPEHPLGTTLYGYDILARMIWGARSTMGFAFIPVIISMGGGLVLGTISAYFGGPVDYSMMRLVDLMYVFPMGILTFILIPMLGTDLEIQLIIFGILGIPGNIRFMRTMVLLVKEMLFVKAAKTGGALKFKVMFKHIVPNAISPIIISVFWGAAGTILGLAGLGFVGLGDQSVATWGTDINWGVLGGLLSGRWATIIPGLFLGITSAGFMLVGDGFRDALDPRFHK
ncbi:MAG: ABC transporter permease [Candidatus Hodarchaeales archaeon]|jgi:peptide/nickel transport system permease protein